MVGKAPRKAGNSWEGAPEVREGSGGPQMSGMGWEASQKSGSSRKGRQKFARCRKGQEGLPEVQEGS